MNMHSDIYEHANLSKFEVYVYENASLSNKISMNMRAFRSSDTQ